MVPCRVPAARCRWGAALRLRLGGAGARWRALNENVPRRPGCGGAGGTRSPATRSRNADRGTRTSALCADCACGTVSDCAGSSGLSACVVCAALGSGVVWNRGRFWNPRCQSGSAPSGAAASGRGRPSVLRRCRSAGGNRAFALGLVALPAGSGGAGPSAPLALAARGSRSQETGLGGPRPPRARRALSSLYSSISLALHVSAFPFLKVCVVCM